MTKQSKVAAEAAADNRIHLNLSQLFVHDSNVRAGTDADAAELDKLVASIRSVGLLQPLVVTLDETGNYGVVAGRRRFLALDRIASEEGGDPFVPVIIIDADKASEASIAENYAREQMSTRDLYTAFKKLQDEGKDEASIGAAFGWDDKRVKRVLRLSNLADPIRDAWFAGDINDGTAQAYAATDKHEIQLAVWERIGKGYHPGSIRSEIMQLISGGASQRELEFVGLDAYKEAGGRFEQDLFTDTVAILDKELVTKLATKKLAAEKKRIAKELGVKIEWGGDVPTTNRWGYAQQDYDCRVRLQGVEEFASEADEKRAAEIDAIFEQAEYAEAEIDDDQAEALQEELDAIMERKIVKQVKLEGVDKLIGVGPTIGYHGDTDFTLFYPSREAAGLPPVDAPKDGDEDCSARYSLSSSRPYESAGSDVALANKKAMGVGKDALAAMQVIFGDAVASESFADAEAGGTTGLDTLLFILARRVIWPHSGPAGLPDIRLGEGRGPFKVRKIAGDKPDLDELLGKPAWLTEKFDALAYDGFKEWIGVAENRGTLGALLLWQLWHPLAGSFSETNKPPIVRLVAQDLDPGPTDWASRFDRRKVADLMSHKARCEALNSFGLADHAKGLKKGTSTDFLMKVLDADADQRRLWGIDEETGAAIDAWLPVELEIHGVERPNPEAEDAEDDEDAD